MADQLRLAACGDDWVNQALNRRLPIKVTNKLSFEVHQQKGVVRCVEHIPRHRRSTSSKKEILRIVAADLAPDEVIDLMRLRASYIGQTLLGKTVTELGFVISGKQIGEPAGNGFVTSCNQIGVKLQAGVQLRAGDIKLGSIKNTTNDVVGSPRETAAEIIDGYKQQLTA